MFGISVEVRIVSSTVQELRKVKRESHTKPKTHTVLHRIVGRLVKPSIIWNK